MDDKCPLHTIEIPEDREVVFCDDLRHEWHGDEKGYFLVKLEEGLICCGFVGTQDGRGVPGQGPGQDHKGNS